MRRSISRPLLLSIALLPTLSAAWGAGQLAAQTATRAAVRQTPQPSTGEDDALERALDTAQAAQGSAHYAEAAAAYATATRLSPRLPELWANRGLMEHLSNQPAAALASFHQALSLRPGLFTALLFSGVDLVATGKPGEAVPFLRKALLAQPRNFDAQLALARAYAALHQPRSAAEAFQTGTVLEPGNASAWYGLAIASLDLIEEDGGALASRFGSSAWARMLYADELLTQGRFREATRLYQESSRDATPEQRMKFLRVLNGAAESDASTPAAPSTLNAEVMAPLREALQPASSAEACASLATAACAFFAGDYGRSASLASAASKRNPSDVEALYWSVKANERLAALAFERFSSLAPQSPATFDLTGDLYRRRSLFAEARAEYAKALAVDPHDPAALLGTAAACLAEGHNDDALTAARAGLAGASADPKIMSRFNLIASEALIAEHHFAEARPFLDQSLLHEPGPDARVHALRGQVDADAGDTDAAIAELRLGLSSDRDGSLHFQLYRLLRKTGDLAGARQAEAGARALQAQRLEHAATAVEEMQVPDTESRSSSNETTQHRNNSN